MGILSFFRSDKHLYVPEELLAKDLAGKRALVTGGAGKFGKVIAEALVKQGADVVIAGRSIDTCKQVATDINAKGLAGNVSAMRVDLASLASVREFASTFTAENDKLHILIENAAVCGVPNVPTVDGFEPCLGINHYGAHAAFAPPLLQPPSLLRPLFSHRLFCIRLQAYRVSPCDCCSVAGHLLLRHELEPLLAASAPATVVTIGSALHDRLFTNEATVLDLEASATHFGWTTDPNTDGLKQWMAYARSKLANVLSAKAAGPRLAQRGVTIVSVHPGVDPTTGLFRASPMMARMMALFGPLTGTQSTWQSVQTILYCALEAPDKLQPGAFYSQYYPFGYRNGATAAAWPMESPNPLVNATDAARFEECSYVALGLAPPAGKAGKGGDGDSNSPTSVLGHVAPTPGTSEVLM